MGFCWCCGLREWVGRKWWEDAEFDEEVEDGLEDVNYMPEVVVRNEGVVC